MGAGWYIVNCASHATSHGDTWLGWGHVMSSAIARTGNALPCQVCIHPVLDTT